MAPCCKLKFAAWFPHSGVCCCSLGLLLWLWSRSQQRSSRLAACPHPQDWLRVGAVGTLGAGTLILPLLGLDKVKMSIAPISGPVWQSWQARQGSEPSVRRGQRSPLISCLGEVWERQEKW